MTKHEHVIGRYRLQPGRGLLADGITVSIGPRALDILTVLVEAEGALVTKDRLMERVWPGLIVEEHNIQVHISALRKALGDDAGWILTVPRHGYRFIGPTIQAADAPLSDLPRPFGRLFGREEELATIRSLLERTRLVTIAGPGGIGKTRIGLELAHELGGRYREGAVFVDFSVLEDPSLVASLIATALRIELKGDRPAEQLTRRLGDRELLILLDNCEHVVDAIAPLAERILVEAPGISLLATSREPLACLGEQVYRLPLLPVPADDAGSADEVLSSPAVALLVDRLKAADQRFKLTELSARAASIICRRLDGLPLAIEMVGALAPGLGLETLATRLEETFRLPYSVTRTVTPRHRSLEATLDWSHALLSPAEKVLLRRLSVFPGPFSLAAVETVASGGTLAEARCGEVLAGLVRKSLVSIEPVAAPRSYRLLETIRTYAGEKLVDAGEQPALSTRHAEYVAGMLERAARDWAMTADEMWLDRHRWLLADLRVALRWSFGPGGDKALGLLIAGRVDPLWQMLGLITEGRRWAATAVAALTRETPNLVAAHVWYAAGCLTGGRVLDLSIQALRKAAYLFSRENDSIDRGMALALLGQMMAQSGEAVTLDILTEARALLERGGGNRRLGICATSFGMFYASGEAWSQARREYELARALSQAAGADRQAAAISISLADATWAEGDLATAIATTRETADLVRRQGHWHHLGHAVGNLAGMLTAQGDLEGALVAAREAVPLCREDGFLDWLLYHLALRAAKAGRPEDAARLLGYAKHVTTSGRALHVNERKAVEELIAILDDRLGLGRMEVLLAAGQHLSEDQAIALALA